jgi:hypothetical protein
VDKRRLLARVAANAPRGGAEAEVDAQQLLLRTVTALDPIHITLLVIIGRLEDRDTRASNPEERRAERAAMEAEWSSGPDLMDPALAALEREGWRTACSTSAGLSVPGNCARTGDCSSTICLSTTTAGCPPSYSSDPSRLPRSVRRPSRLRADAGHGGKGRLRA